MLSNHPLSAAIRSCLLRSLAIALLSARASVAFADEPPAPSPAAPSPQTPPAEAPDEEDKDTIGCVFLPAPVLYPAPNGSTQTGMSLTQPMLSRLPLSRPDARGGAVRSFESVAHITPGAKDDAYGVSFNGATSPENRVLIDGLSVNNPSYGVGGMPLSTHFIERIDLLSGGYEAEYGRSTGGILDVVTKSGGYSLHGSTWLEFSPGALSGERAPVSHANTTIQTERRLDFVHNVGADIGGPIVPSKLFFYGGALFGATRYRVETAVHRRLFHPSEPIRDESGEPHPEVGNDFLYDEDGYPVTERVKGSEEVRPAVMKTLQTIGKLTFVPAPLQTVELTVFGDRTRSGGDGQWGIDPESGGIEGGAGDVGALAHVYHAETSDVVLRWKGAMEGTGLSGSSTLGWHHQRTARLPSDGSALGSNTGLAGSPRVTWQRFFPLPRDAREFREVPGGSATCAPPLVRDVDNDGDGAPDATVRRDAQCPVSVYSTGGPGFIDDLEMDRVHYHGTVMKEVEALGWHVLKGGIDIEQTLATHTRAYSGTVGYAENGSGSAWNETSRYGFLTGPDAPVVKRAQKASVGSTQIGAFVQDSWKVLGKVLLNVGVRYDAQLVFGEGGKLHLALPFQLSPRIGASYDITQTGRSVVFARYARYYEGLPLDIAVRSFPGEAMVGARHRASRCDPSGRDADKPCGEGSIVSRSRVFGSSYDPSERWASTHGSATPVDPKLMPQALDEVVLGGRYDVLSDASVGLVYTHTSLASVIEDMSHDDGTTLFIGNPGSGSAKSFPSARRDYDALNVLFVKSFSDKWLAQVSYTLSFLRGNYAGLYRAETGQLDPNITSDFDAVDLTVNRDGPLPGDRTHEIKAYAARDFPFDEFLPGPSNMALTVGLGYTGRSGGPTSFLGSHPLYGGDEVFILKRGTGEPLPWIHSIDTHVQTNLALSRGTNVGVFMDVFNLFNFQEATAVDETYTFSQINVVPGAVPVRDKDGKLGPDPSLINHLDGTLVAGGSSLNPNFGRPTAYQSPLTFRFGMTMSF